MANELTIPDQRMLQLPADLKALGRIKYKQQFWDAAGMHKQNVRRIKMGLQHFTAVQIAAVCKEYGVNGNWVLGIGKAAMFNEPQPTLNKALRSV